MAHQTLRIQRFADPWLTKPYKYNCFPCLQCFLCCLCFTCFTCFPCVLGDCLFEVFKVFFVFHVFPVLLVFMVLQVFHVFKVLMFSLFCCLVPGRARSAKKSHHAGAISFACPPPLSSCRCEGGRGRPKSLSLPVPGRARSA